MGSPGETAAQTFVLGDRLITVMTRGVYAVKMADSVDPNRTDFNLPNIITQPVVGYGAESPIISRTLLTGRELFRCEYLGLEFDEQRALGIAFEATENLAAMVDLKIALEQDFNLAAEQLQGSPVGSALKLPITPNLRSRGESFIRHADLTHQATKALCDLFFPRKKSNEKWSIHIVEALGDTTAASKQSQQFLSGVVSHIDAVRDFRNASEHPDAAKGVTFSDFGVQPGFGITRPSLEIRHPKSPLAPTDLVVFMDTVIEDCSGIFESTAALLCSLSIRVPPVINCRVAMLDDAHSKARYGIRYVYEATFVPGAVAPPEP